MREKGRKLSQRHLGFSPRRRGCRSRDWWIGASNSFKAFSAAEEKRCKRTLLFAEFLSRPIYLLVRQLHVDTARRPVHSGDVSAYQSSGEFLREDPHYHCIVLESGFDERGEFVCIPLGDIRRRSEHFRRVVINAHLATSLINWKHSGFSVDYAIGVPAFSIQARQALSQ